MAGVPEPGEEEAQLIDPRRLAAGIREPFKPQVRALPLVGGEFRIELEGRDSVALAEGQISVVPRGMNS